MPPLRVPLAKLLVREVLNSRTNLELRWAYGLTSRLNQSWPWYVTAGCRLVSLLLILDLTLVWKELSLRGLLFSLPRSFFGCLFLGFSFPVPFIIRTGLTTLVKRLFGIMTDGHGLLAVVGCISL